MDIFVFQYVMLSIFDLGNCTTREYHTETDSYGLKKDVMREVNFKFFIMFNFYLDK